MSAKLLLTYLFFFCCLWLTGQSEAQSNDDLALTPQQELVAALSGEIPAVGETKMKSRWTAAERALSRQCLQRYFGDLGITMLEHAYQMPNVHAFQDLLLGPFKGANLYGVLPATSLSEEFVILGAHYDTERFAPGANDNASAIAAIYGTVKNLTTTATRGKNLLVVFFDQEEEENVGSRAFIDFLEGKNWLISSVHTIDQLGWDMDADRAVELELPDKGLEEVYRAAGKELGVPIRVTGVNASDHQAFRAAGYVVTGISEEFANGDTSPFKDSPKDTFDTVNFDYVASATRLLTTVMNKLLIIPE